MAATVEICESNGSTETITHNISNDNWGATDAANLTPSSYPITVGANGFFKLQRVHVTGGTFNKVDNIRAWISAGAYVTGEGVQCSMSTIQGTYDTYKITAFAQPNATTYSGLTMPVAEPGTANLGIGGSLTGSLTAVGYSDYCKHQVQSTVSTPPGNGNQKTISWKYDEQ